MVHPFPSALLPGCVACHRLRPGSTDPWWCPAFPEKLFRVARSAVPLDSPAN
jgi:hypothetical protein